MCVCVLECVCSFALDKKIECVCACEREGEKGGCTKKKSVFILKWDDG